MFIYSPQGGWAYGINENSCLYSCFYTSRGSRMIMERSQDFDSGLSSDPSTYYLLTMPGTILGRINVVLMKPIYQGDIILSFSYVILIVN